MVLKIFIGDSALNNLLQGIFNHIEYSIVEDLSVADYILFPDIVPGDISESLAFKLARYKYISEDYNKKMLIFIVSDFSDSLENFKNAIIFRTSLDKSRQSENERILPYFWVANPDEALAPVSNVKPKISFCGAITHPHRLIILAYVKTFCSDFIDCEFVVRQKNWGEGVVDAAKEFRQNMQKCEFALCPRGCGNFSVRFYEALAAGRIPVLVDTDILLPFENQIDWHKSIVLAKTVQELPKCISNFLSTTDLITAQIECRRLFEEFISIKQFSQYLYNSMVTGNF